MVGCTTIFALIRVISIVYNECNLYGNDKMNVIRYIIEYYEKLYKKH